MEKLAKAKRELQKHRRGGFSDEIIDYDSDLEKEGKEEEERKLVEAQMGKLAVDNGKEEKKMEKELGKKKKKMEKKKKKKKKPTKRPSGKDLIDDEAEEASDDESEDESEDDMNIE